MLPRWKRTAKTGQALLGLGVGVLTGLGLKLLWSATKLPGYGQILFQVSPTGDCRNANAGVYYGYDDLAVAGVGGAIAVVGAAKRNTMATFLGVGSVIGSTVEKYFETQRSCIVPISGSFAS